MPLQFIKTTDNSTLVVSSASINTLNGIMQLTNGTESSSINTGTLQITGGIGVIGNIFCSNVDATGITINGSSVSPSYQISALINSSILNEVSARNNAITTAVYDMDTITSRNNALTSAINNEVTGRNNAITTAVYDMDTITSRNNALTTSINNEVTARNNAITTSINTEVTGRNTAIASSFSNFLTSSNIFTNNNTFVNITANSFIISNIDSNTFYGYRTGISNTGANNTGFGWRVLQFNSGGDNTSIGHNSMANNQGGGKNIAIGEGALFNNISGSNCSAVGYTAGSNNVSGNFCTYLGYNSNCSSNFNNSTAMGSNSLITSNNQIVLGTVSETVYFRGGMNMSIGSISTSQSLVLPILSTYITSNTSVPITITLPNGATDGLCVNIRRGVGSTGLVTIAYLTICGYNTTTLTNSVPNNISSSYIYYYGVWYQQSSF